MTFFATGNGLAISGTTISVDLSAYKGAVDFTSESSVSLGPIELNGGADAMSNNEYSGSTLGGLIAGEAITQWDLVYFDSTDSEWKQADADATGEWPARGMAVAAGTDGNELVVLHRGVVRNDAWNFSTVGGNVYLDETTAGGLTQTAPSDTGDCLQIVGWRCLMMRFTLIFRVITWRHCSETADYFSSNLVGPCCCLCRE